MHTTITVMTRSFPDMIWNKLSDTYLTRLDFNFEVTLLLFPKCGYNTLQLFLIKIYFVEHGKINISQNVHELFSIKAELISRLLVDILIFLKKPC